MLNLSGDKWKRILEMYRKRDITVKEIANSHNISPGTFYNYLKKE